MFKSKFAFGKEYVSDCYHELANEVTQHIKRLTVEDKKNPVACRRKARLLQSTLQEVLSSLDHPDVENHSKPAILLTELLPVLQMPTSYGATAGDHTVSFKAVTSLATLYSVYPLTLSRPIVAEDKVAATKDISSDFVIVSPASSLSGP
jgi:hypothetical protein